MRSQMGVSKIEPNDIRLGLIALIMLNNGQNFQVGRFTVSKGQPAAAALSRYQHSYPRARRGRSWNLEMTKFEGRAKRRNLKR